jgi:hypothetical protein
MFRRLLSAGKHSLDALTQAYIVAEIAGRDRHKAALP